jgi:hypothetical protein
MGGILVAATFASVVEEEEANIDLGDVDLLFVFVFHPKAKHGADLQANILLLLPPPWP